MKASFKKLMLVSLVMAANIVSAHAEIDWQNPAVLCPEEVLPKGLPCPDFTQVKNPLTDFPVSLSAEERNDWKNNKLPDLRSCRNREVMRREALKPGTFSAGVLENSWMLADSGNNVSEKLNAIEEASKKFGVPPQILIGAMRQESLLSSLGITPDGGNYSCGMAQLNIQEWCQSMNSLPKNKQEELGWPAGIKCDSDELPTDIVKPFYDFARRNARNRPDYLFTAEDFKGITYKDVKHGHGLLRIFSKLFSKNKMNKKTFAAVNSFVQNCQSIPLSVSAKAQALKSLFDNFVPAELKNAEQYTNGKTFPRACANPYPVSAYPLHTGWLLAVAMYNAGPLQPKIVRHYYKAQNTEFPRINPLELIEALHWGGKWKEKGVNIAITNQKGDELTQIWYKSCIVQRHVARVIQHVTIPSESIAKALDVEGCKKDSLPEYRKYSSGVKDN